MNLNYGDFILFFVVLSIKNVANFMGWMYMIYTCIDIHSYVVVFLILIF